MVRSDPLLAVTLDRWSQRRRGIRIEDALGRQHGSNLDALLHTIILKGEQQCPGLEDDSRTEEHTRVGSRGSMEISFPLEVMWPEASKHSMPSAAFKVHT